MQQHSVHKIKISGVEKEDEFVSKSMQKLSVLLLALLLIVGLIPASVSAATNPSVNYRTHVQNEGWQDWKKDGTMSGTSAKGLRLEGIEVKLDTQGYDLGINYQTHIQNIGWEADTSRGWKSNGTMSGTEGLSYRLEAIQIKLTGADADKFDIYYRVHAQNIGWMGWAKNAENAGTAGYGYRLEGIEVIILPKGSAAPGTTENAFVQLSDIEQVLDKMIGTWGVHPPGSSTIFKITKTSPTTGHITLLRDFSNGNSDSLDFDFWINTVDINGTTMLNVDMNSIVSVGNTAKFSTLLANTSKWPNKLILGEGMYTRQ